MKKLHLGFLLIAATIIFNAPNAVAQYEKGDKLLNIGVGLRSFYIPIGASLEVGITDEISVGGMAAVASWSGYGSVTYFGARGSYHVNELLKLNEEKLDLYAGAGLGYQSWNYKYSVGSYGSGVFPLFFIGGRYYFKPKIAVFAEAGGGYAGLNGGISFKF